MKGLSHVAIFVADIDRSRQFYEEILDLRPAETMEIVSPLHGGQIRGLFLSAGKQHHDLLLIEQYSAEGELIPPAQMGLHHLAFELEDGMSLDSFVQVLADHRIEPSYGPIRHYDGPGGDGGAGGNSAVYFSDPDGHMVEVCRDMDPFTVLRDAAGVAGGEQR